MKTLYMIRHAESEANRDRIMASRLPFPLTEAGEADAKLIASELKSIVSIDKIVTSPLLRARQTADCFAEAYGVEPEVDERISEQELGKFAGMTYDEVKEQQDYETETQKRWDWVFEGGESYKMIADRVKSFFEDLEKESENQNILIVTHAVTFRLIKAVLENTLPTYPSQFPNNGEIWKVPFSELGKSHDIESILLGNSAKFTHNP